MASAIANVLEYMGCTPVIVDRGGDALHAATTRSFSLIVMDLELEGINGSAVCRMLRTIGITTPLIMVTEGQGSRDESRALESGADDFVRKPFEPMVLAARAMSLLRRQGAFAQPSLSIGAFRFDPETRCCIAADGSTQPLTKREASVLELLVQSSGAPVSRRRLLDEVWGGDYGGDPNCVDVYIGYLRRKLGAESILTVRGHGFAAAPAPDRASQRR